MSDQRRNRTLAGVVLVLGLGVPAGGCLSILPGRPAGADRSQTTFSSEDPPAAAPGQPPLIDRRSEVRWSIEPGPNQPGKGMEGAGIVGPDGTLELGPYGSVGVAGMTEDAAGATVGRHLSQYLKDPKVRVRLAARENAITPVVGWETAVEWNSEGQGTQPARPQPQAGSRPGLLLVNGQSLLAEVADPAPGSTHSGDEEAAKSTRAEIGGDLQAAAPPLPAGGLPPVGVPTECSRMTLPPYVIGPPDVLRVESLRGLVNQPVTGPHLVRPDGTVSLGSYGAAYVAGLTIDQARDAIARVILGRLDPKVISLKDVVDGLSVDVLAYHSKAYYVILDGGDLGEQVLRFPITGAETVLDAISQNVARLGGGAPGPVSSRCRVWVARKSCQGKEQILPVDWVGLTQRGRGDTNYQLLPGDRLYVQCDSPGTADAAVDPIPAHAEAPRPRRWWAARRP